MVKGQLTQKIFFTENLSLTYFVIFFNWKHRSKHFYWRLLLGKGMHRISGQPDNPTFF
jgi:hypothetical protein